MKYNYSKSPFMDSITAYTLFTIIFFVISNQYSWCFCAPLWPYRWWIFESQCRHSCLRLSKETLTFRFSSNTINKWPVHGLFSAPFLSHLRFLLLHSLFKVAPKWLPNCCRVHLSSLRLHHLMKKVHVSIRFFEVWVSVLWVLSSMLMSQWHIK